MAWRRERGAPLPVRNGLNPSRVRQPTDGSWATTADFLRDRFPDDAERVAAKLAAGEVMDEFGEPIRPDTPFRPQVFVYLYRDPNPEPRVPFEIEVLYQDDSLLVVDKPHFLATTPRGAFVTESATVRLRRDRDEPELSPIHRLDRLTAGVLVFSRRKEERNAYQSLFLRREVAKTYLAVAPAGSAELPAERSSRMIKERGTPTAREVPGEPNSHTRIAQLDRRGAWARYELSPTTGRTHQLRVHMNALGRPIRNDPFYPHLLEVDRADYSAPLQLLAQTLAFTDPISGRPHTFVSRRTLRCWPE